MSFLALGVLASGGACSPARDGQSELPTQPDWPQWGGPERNFRTDEDTSLAGDWEVEVPLVAWRRQLGDGYSGIAVAGPVAYTMYRQDHQEIVIALDSETGLTKWEVPVDQPLSERSRPAGPGPYSTPAVHLGRVFALASAGQILALDTETGETLWQRQIVEPGRENYSPSPLLVHDLVVVFAGGASPGLLALEMETGDERWRSEALALAPSSPQWLSASGGSAGPAILQVGAESILAVDPDSGATVWRLPYPNPNGANVLTPVSFAEGFFVSSGPDKGSTAFAALPAESDAQPVTLWESSRMRVFYSNAIERNGMIVASNGSVGPAILSAVDLATGETLWRTRDVSRVNLIGTSEGAIALSEDGELLNLRFDRSEVEVLARLQVANGDCWTPPSLVGNRLYLRNRNEMMRVDLPTAN